METTENDTFEANILIEAKLLEQEHRPTHLVLNYINRKKKFPNEKDPRRKAVQRAIIWRLFFSPTVLAVGGSTILGIITAWILIKQTNIIDDQTKIFKEQTNIIDEQKLLLEEQNKKIEIQANLEDANRRNNLVFLMDNVLNRIDDELKHQRNIDSSLSKPLLARIQALGQGFQPYKFIDYSLKDSLQNDSLGLTKLYSPERGQLLLSLANSGISEKTMLLIYRNTTFGYAYLKAANLNRTFLVNINLDNSYLRNASLRNADLRNASFKNADLRQANLKNADLHRANFYEANLNEANLNEVNLSIANLYEANLSGAYLRNSNLSRTHLHGANLSKADLFEADLSEANLRKADLRETNLSGANLENIRSIDSCLVHRKDWLTDIRDWYELKGAAILAKKYKVEEYKDGDFIVVKK